MGHSRVWIGIGMGVLGAVAAWAAVDPEPAAPPADAAATVRTAEVRAAPEHRVVLLSGVTRAVDRADVAFTVSGRLGQRRVRLGDRVTAGQVLAVLERDAFDHALRGAEASVDDLEARLAQVERDRQRLEALGTSVSAAELERARTEARSVNAALDGARARADESGRQRGEAVLRAPFDGVVAAVLAEPGEAVAPGAPVVRLSGGSGLEVEVQAPERIWAGLSPGQPVVIALTGLSRAAPGTVRSVAGAAAAAGLLPVVVSVDAPSDPLLVAGLTAEVALPVPVAPGVVVPVGAVVDPVGGAPAVFVLDGAVSRRVSVTPGVLVDDDVVVTGDLRPGQAVVTAGQARLLDGDRVEVLR
jgi:RND family efflux transporter MFP subunit